MALLKRILGIASIVLSVVFIAACLAGIFLSWSINTPITNAVTGVLTGFERVLTAVDNSLERVNSQLSEAQTNIDTIEENVEAAGEILSETSIVYEILDRTVGDELFPRITSASDTIMTVRDSVISFNEILESLDEIPFVDVPTLTEELDTAAERMTAAQSDVEAFRDELHAVKEEAISQPVAEITERTTLISNELEATQQNLSDTQENINEELETTSSIKDRIPGLIDLSSAVLSFIFLWFALGQACLIVLAWNGLIAPRNPGPADGIVSATNE